MKYFVELSDDFPNTLPLGRLFELVEGEYTGLDRRIPLSPTGSPEEYVAEFGPSTGSSRE